MFLFTALDEYDVVSVGFLFVFFYFLFCRYDCLINPMLIVKFLKTLLMDE